MDYQYSVFYSVGNKHLNHVLNIYKQFVAAKTSRITAFIIILHDFVADSYWRKTLNVFREIFKL